MNDDLRKAAEAKLANNPVASVPHPDALLHELKVHQIELEMQNENLRQAQIEMEKSRDRYADLYDFAPVAYLTVNREGMISDANLTCAELLGVERSKLFKSRFDRFVASDAQDIWHRFFMHAMHRNEKLTTELTLSRPDGTTLDAQLDGARSGDAIRLSLTDNTQRRQAEDSRRRALLLEEQEAARQKLEYAYGEWINALDAVNDPIFMHDRALRILRCNKAYRQCAGRPFKEIIGQRYYEVFPVMQAPMQSCLLLADAEEEMTFGDAVYRSRAFAIRDEKGGYLYSVHILEDITEIRRDRQRQSIQARIAGIFAMGGGDEERFNEVLKVVLEAMQSPFGVFGYIDTDGALVVPTMTRPVWDKCNMPEKSVRFPREEWGSSSWPRALREKRGNFFNEPSLIIPEGHVPIQRSIAMPILYRDEAIGLLQVANKQADYTQADVDLLQMIAADVAPLLDALLRQESASVQLQWQLLKLQDNLKDTVRAISTIVELRDPYTAGHQLRVADLARAIAGKLGLSDDRVHGLHIAATVHDLGKIQVPAEILSKPGRLSETEYGLIKIHPQAGYDILKGIDFPWPVADMVLQHHERMDGSGYPQGLKGDDILMEARILCVADVLEAMASHRPYRPGLGVEVALADIVKGRATLYDAEVVDACVALFREGYVLAG